MKKVNNLKLLYSFLLVAAMAFQASAGVIILEGVYQGKNLYVQNPFAGSGVGFCTFEVTINGDISTDEISSSAFEIDFTNYNLKLGDKVIVKINHHNDCRPKVLNPEVLEPKSTFEIIDIAVDQDGVLKWKSKNETGELDYIIEQFRWNKWVKVGEVKGKGQVDEQSYSFQIKPHSGENTFRVKQIDYTNKPRYGPSVKYTDADIIPITFSPRKVKKVLIFSHETMFEVYDAYGNIVKKGFANQIDVINLDKGIYYLNYDSKSERFIKN